MNHVLKRLLAWRKEDKEIKTIVISSFVQGAFAEFLCQLQAMLTRFLQFSISSTTSSRPTGSHPSASRATALRRTGRTRSRLWLRIPRSE